MLKLYQFPKPKTFPNFSPFCVKLETYLKMAEIPYENVYTLNLAKNPKKLMPYIEIDGEIKGDSSLIIDFLKEKNGDKVDFWLSTEQQSTSNAFISMLENHLVLFMLYFRWVDKDGWLQFREILFAKAPKIIKILIGNSLTKKVAKRLYLNGISRFTKQEMLHLIKKDLTSLSNYLADKQFFFGDKPTLLDAVCFAVYGGIVCVPIETDFKKLANSIDFNNLKEHSIRMLNRFYKFAY